MQDFELDAIAKKSVKGVLALVSRTFLLNIISLGAFFVITSILAPATIGIYTAVIAVQRIVSFFTDVGFGAALIQKKEEITQDDVKTTFTLQAGLTLLILIVVFVFRTQISDLVNIGDDGEKLLLVLILTIFLSSFKTIPSILLERTIKFEKLIIPQIAESIVFNTVLIFLAIRGQGINAFPWAFLISSIIGIPFYYFISPWKAQIGIVSKSLHHLKFGVQFQAKNILATLKDDFLTVFLARVLSFTEIGYIGFGQRLAFFVYRYVVDSVTKVTFSTYSRMQHNKEFLRSAIEKSLFFVSAFMFPLLFGLIVISPYLIDFFPRWNNKWEGAIVSLIFFSLNAVVSSMSGILVNVLDSIGKVKVTLRLMVYWTILTWVLTPVLIFWIGYNGVAVASFIVTLTLFYTIHLVQKEIPFSFIKCIYKPLIAALTMALIVFGFSYFFVNNMMLLIFAILIGSCVYCGIMYLIAKDEFVEDFKKIILKK